MMFEQVALAVAALWAFAAAVVAGVAITRRRAMSAPADAALPEHVALIRPCAGAPPWLAAALRSGAEARCPLPLRHRFTVASAEDAARPVAEAACAALRAEGHDAEVWIIDVGEAPNHKAAQIAGAARRLSAGGALICADSDADLAGVDLGALLRAAAGGAAWVPPVERAPAQGLGDAASQAVLGASLHAFPLLCALDPEGLVGKLFAVSPAGVEALDGFAPLVDYLGEDMELSRRIRAAGGEVRPLDATVTALAVGRRWGEAVERYSRWMTVIRAQRPALLLTYPLCFCPTLPVLSLAGLGAGASPLGAGIIAGICLATRFAVAGAARRFAGRPLAPHRWPVDVILAEITLTASFIKALSGRTVAWGGRRLTVDRQGRLRRQ